MSQTNKLPLIELARGLAALAVTFYHAGKMMNEAQYSGHVGANGIFELGFLGVDFFFVLSGFIILYVHIKDVGQSGELSRYTWRRLVRIFPTYWMVFALVLSFNLLFQSTKPQLSFLWFLSQISLIVTEPWLGPAWTLKHELLFYLLFGCLIVSRKLGVMCLILWVASMVACLVFFPGVYDMRLSRPSWLKEPFFELLLHPINFAFLFGMLVAFVARRKPEKLTTLIAVLVGALVVGVWYAFTNHITWQSSIRYALVPTGFAALLAILVWLSRFNIPVWRGFVGLGSISYSLYLIHILPIGVLYAGSARLGIYEAVPEILLIASGVAMAIFAATLVYFFFEKPSLSKLQRLFKR